MIFKAKCKQIDKLFVGDSLSENNKAYRYEVSDIGGKSWDVIGCVERVISGNFAGFEYCVGLYDPTSPVLLEPDLILSYPPEHTTKNFRIKSSSGYLGLGVNDRADKLKNLIGSRRNKYLLNVSLRNFVGDVCEGRKDGEIKFFQISGWVDLPSDYCKSDIVAYLADALQLSYVDYLDYDDVAIYNRKILLAEERALQEVKVPASSIPEGDVGVVLVKNHAALEAQITGANSRKPPNSPGKTSPNKDGKTR